MISRLLDIIGEEMLVGFSKEILPHTEEDRERIATNKLFKGYVSYPKGYVYFMTDSPDTLHILLSEGLDQYAYGLAGDKIYNAWQLYKARKKRKSEILLEIRQITAQLEFTKFFPETFYLSKNEIVELKKQRKLLEEEKKTCYKIPDEFGGFVSSFKKWLHDKGYKR